MSYPFSPGSMESSAEDVSTDATIISSAEVEKRIGELLSQIGHLENLRDNPPAPDAAGEEYDEDDEYAREQHEAELAELLKLRDAAESSCNWYATGGATLVRDDHLITFAQEYSEELYGADFTVWPFDHVDWEAAARAMARYDWRSVDYDGVTYWVR